MSTVRVLMLWVLASLTVAVAACAGSGEPAAPISGASSTSTASQPTATSTTPTSTIDPPTAIEGTTTSTQPRNVARKRAGDTALVVADEDGIRLQIDGDVVVVLEGIPSRVAFADGMGGVVYQVSNPVERPWWDWSPGLSEPVLTSPAEHPPDSSIMWIPVVGSPPEVLVPDDGETWISLVDATTLGGRPVVVYEREVSIPDSCAGLDDLTRCYFESLRAHLTARDLLNGEEWSLGLSGGFEWRAVASFGGSRAVVNVSDPDHGFPAEMKVIDFEAMSALDQDARITSVVGDDTLTIRLSEGCASDAMCEGPGIASMAAQALSRDGSSLAFVEYYISCCGTPQNETVLVVWDLEGFREGQRVHLGPDRWVEWSDHDGIHTLLGLSDGAILVVGVDGTITTLPAGSHYSFWDA